MRVKIGIVMNANPFVNKAEKMYIIEDFTSVERRCLPFSGFILAYFLCLCVTDFPDLLEILRLIF